MNGKKIFIGVIKVTCASMIREKEKRLKRKLTAEEKAEIMEENGHTTEEIQEATGIVYA